MTMDLTQNVVVRRNNGQCQYGPWLSARAEEVPTWVESLIADEIAEHDADSGQVEQGGSKWDWRKATRRNQ